MRGKTNIIARHNAIVNGNVENFVVANGETIEVGDFVEISYADKNMKTFFDNIGDKQTCSIDDERVLIAYKPGENPTNDTNIVIDIFKWNGNELVKTTNETLITEYKTINHNITYEFLMETDGYKYFYKFENNTISSSPSNKFNLKFSIFRISKIINKIERKIFTVSYDNELWGSSYSGTYTYNYSHIVENKFLSFFKIDNENLLYFGDLLARYSAGGTNTRDLSFFLFVNLNLTLLSESEDDFDFSIVLTKNNYGDKSEIFDSKFMHTYNFNYFGIKPIVLLNDNVLNIIFSYYYTSYDDYYFNIDRIKVGIGMLNYIEMKTLIYIKNENSYTTENSYITKINNNSFLTYLAVKNTVYCYVFTNYGEIRQSVNFYSGNRTGDGTMAYLKVRDDVIFGAFSDSNYSVTNVDFAMLLYDSGLNSVTLIPNKWININYGIDSKIFSDCFFVLGDKIFVIKGKRYDIFTFMNNELHKGESSNNVKKFSGNYNAIGFAKTGGTSGNVIQVYTPKGVS